MSVLKIKNDSGEWQSITAIQGEKGDTPVKGTDYWTAADKEEIVTETLNSIPLATTETAGKVKPDGTTITIDEDGTIHSAGGSSSASDVSFDNTDTGLEATNVQSALVEINTDLVGSEEVQNMIDTSTLEPLVSPTTTGITFKASEIYDGTSQNWLFSKLTSYSGLIDFLLDCDIDIPSELSKNCVQIIYKTSNSQVRQGSYAHFQKGHIYSFMLMTNNATYWSMMAENFVRNSNRAEIPYGQPIFVSPNSNSYPRYLYQVIDVTPYNQSQVDKLAAKIDALVDGNEVSY